jgi:hypothetical protein
MLAACRMLMKRREQHDPPPLPLRQGWLHPPRIQRQVNPAGALVGRASEAKGGSHRLGRGPRLGVSGLRRAAT